MTPAEELRQAATKLRDLAAKALTPANDTGWEGWGDIMRLVNKGLADGSRDVDARISVTHWIDNLSPAIAEPLASMLERAARGEDTVSGHHDADILAFARYINS